MVDETDCGDMIEVPPGVSLWGREWGTVLYRYFAVPD